VKRGPRSARDLSSKPGRFGVRPLSARTLSLVPARRHPDHDLIEGIRRGDAVAFERVFRAHFASLCAVVNGYVRSRDVAEEIVQDLLLTLWRRRGELQIRDGLSVYLFGAARNRALNWVRHARREIAWATAAKMTRETALCAGARAQEDLESRELGAAVALAIAALPERRRLAFQLTQQAGLSHAETAAVMGIAPKTVAIHLGLAREELRARLRELVDR
jgi:RNA polymerase sigma-70 factor, ECF subfamily